MGQDRNSRVAKRDSADERGCIVFLFPVIARRWFEIFFSFVLVKKKLANGCAWELFGYPLKGKFVCATADCASGVIECNGAGAIPPASLTEFTLRGDGGKIITI